MKNLISNLTKGAQVADNFHLSEQEKQEQLSGRHERDMNSDNWLSKSIRPLTLLVLMLLQILIVVLSAFGFEVNETIVIQHGVLLSGAFGFYFSSRKAEKVAAQNAKANVEIEQLKTRHEHRMERKQLKASIRASRRAERKQDQEDYDQTPNPKES